jgi:hypothetical protein
MNLDVGPSLLQAAGVPIPNDMQGKSFLSLVENKKPPVEKRCTIIITKTANMPYRPILASAPVVINSFVFIKE